MASDEPGIEDGTQTVAERPTMRQRDSEPRVDRSPAPQSDENKPSTLSSASAAPTSAAPIEALRRAEIRATRSFCFVALLFASGASVAIPFLPGKPVPTYLFLSTIAAACVALAYLYRRTRNPATYYEGSGVAVSWYVVAAATSGAVPFFGPFSPIPLLLVLGIYFTGSSASFRLTLALFLTVASTQAISSGLVIAGLADPGFVRADALSVRVQILCQVLVQLVLLGTFLISRASRRSSLMALTELERAIRAVAQREALLEEAREALRRAVGTGRGRFSEQQIGRYRLGDLIGRGAMGEVYEAAHSATGETVAVKMLSHASLGKPQHVERFLRELKAAAAITSPNVVRVLEVGDQPLPFLVMERLRGRDLGEVLRGGRMISHDRVIDLLGQVGKGITAAGSAGIVHRDLKPQNVFLDGDTWKVLDFGVSRIADSSDTLTAGHVVGTPAYMAPEQARGGSVDHRADLYALAAIAYRLLTGQSPFSGGEIADLLYRVVHTAPPRPTSIATLPLDVDAALAIGLAKDPDDRFATATELVDAVASALTQKLAPALRDRGHALMIDGAWSSRRTTRAITAR